MSDSGRAAYPGVNGRIAYSYGDAYSGAIWAANPDGTSPTMLTKGSSDYSPSYSANGSRIAFERDNGVAVMNSDGSGQAQLLSGSYSSSSEPPEWQENYKNPEKPSETIPFVKIQTYKEAWHTFTSPSFSPDGSQLAVRESSGKFVYTLTCAVEEAEGAECIGGYGYGEGSYFHAESECVACLAGLITVNSSTGAEVAQVTPRSSKNEDFGPTFGAGGKVAFGRWTGSGSSIFAISSPGAAPVQVTNGPNDYSPDFSPDGSRIVFSHGREIGLVGAAGGPVTLLPLPSPVGVKYSSVDSPAFSPDGSRIVFGRTLNPTGAKTEHGLYTMSIDGSGVAKILDGYGADWQAVAPAPPAPIPATSKARKGKVKLDKKSRATVGTIVCGSSQCALKVLSARLKVGKKACSVKTTLPKKLAPGKKAALKVKVTGKCLGALKKAGKGSLVAKVRVTDALGGKVLTFKSTLVAPAAKKTKHGKK